MSTVFDIRRNNLLTLLSRYRSVAEFNVAVGKRRDSPGFVMIKNRSENSGGKGKPRVMGDALAREIEQKLSLPEGWMDTDHTGTVCYTKDEDEGLIPVRTLMLSGAKQMKKEIVHLDASVLSKYLPGRELTDFSAAIVHDDSMSPALSRGDRVLIDETANGFTTDGIYCLNANGTLVLKRVSFRLDGKHVVRSDARPDESALLEDLSGVTVVGRVCLVWSCKVV